MAQQQKEMINLDDKNGKFCQQSKTHLYACFQQSQTINILKYLTMPNPNTLYFDSGSKNQSSKINNLCNEADSTNKDNKNSKKFNFSKIYDREQKFKYKFSNQITAIIQKLFSGYSQSVLIYGTDEFKKDKLLIGQSQNAGFLLLSLAGIFQYCHQNQLQDQVTIKISCSMFKNGIFKDPFNQLQTFAQSNSQNQQNKNKYNQIQNIICEDKIEQRYLLGSPEIIIRNMKTAMKIINLITKRIQQRRQLKQQNTQNLIFTIKLEIEKSSDKYTEQVYQYNIPKLYIVKLGNPSVVNTLNGVNKNNQWFINLYNYLQSNAIQQRNCLPQGQVKNNDLSSPSSSADRQFNQILIGLGIQTKKCDQGYKQDKDPFTNYIKDVVLYGVADIHCFVSIDNKMTSNECLTAFIFNNYLLSYHTKPKKTILNINKLNCQKLNYQEQLLNLLKFQQNQKIKQIEINQKFKKKYNIDISLQNQKTILQKFGTLAVNIKKKKSSTIHFNTSPKESSAIGLANSKKIYLGANNSSSAESHDFLIRQTLRNLIFHNSNHDYYISWEIKIYFLQYIELINDFIECFNRMQYQYANILSNGCERLNKYIFNEEIQQFFYAKKISLQYSTDLYQTFQQLKKKKEKISEIQDKIMKKIKGFFKNVAYELQSIKIINIRQQFQDLFRIKKQKIITLLKQKQIIAELFKLYNTMSFHFIYEDNLKLKQILQKIKIQYQDQISKILGKDKITTNYDQIIKNIKNSQQNNTNNNLLVQVPHHQTNKQTQIHRQQHFLKNISSKQNNHISRTISISSQSQIFNEKPKQLIHKSISKQSKLIKQKLNKYKFKKQQNQLDKMFMNSNVGIVRSQFNKTLFPK